MIKYFIANGIDKIKLFDIKYKAEESTNNNNYTATALYDSNLKN